MATWRHPFKRLTDGLGALFVNWHVKVTHLDGELAFKIDPHVYVIIHLFMYGEPLVSWPCSPMQVWQL